MRMLRFVLAIIAVSATSALAQPLTMPGAPCARPPVQHCPDAGCAADVVTSGGAVVEQKTGRTYFLDYPCDLKRGEKVTFILSLHGGGSYGNWQRHYFPLLDYTDKYRLVVATPFSPRRVWSAEDDGYLQNIVSSVDRDDRQREHQGLLAGRTFAGRSDIHAHHLQRVLRDESRWLPESLRRARRRSGRTRRELRHSRAGRTQPGGNATGRATPPAGPPAGALVIPPPPMCDFSHIFETGEHEISELPKTSARAQKYACSAEAKRREVVDTKAGYVFDGTRQNPGSKAWGLRPRPGKADVFAYRKCRDGRVVADVVRLDKGHTEGLEPKVTEEIVKLMLSARGGKIQHGG